MNDKEALQEALSAAEALSAEVEGLKKTASARGNAVAPVVFSPEALAKTADALIDAGLAKSAQKTEFVDMYSKAPEKILDTLQMLAKRAAVKAPASVEEIGTLRKVASAAPADKPAVDFNKPFLRYLQR